MPNDAGGAYMPPFGMCAVSQPRPVIPSAARNLALSSAESRFRETLRLFLLSVFPFTFAGVAQTSSCDVCERRAMTASSAVRNSRTHAKRRHVCATLRCGNNRTHAKRRHVCATRVTQKQHKQTCHKKALTPNDQSARLLFSMGEGRLALAVASLKSHEYSHGDSHSPASGS